ncbi:MAG: ferric reductase-like transmembrane domain-containing protein [Solirubrobacteraceae bacterium]
MTLPLAATLGPSAYWYLTRATGAVAMLLLTLVVALGVADVRRLSSPRVPRFLIDALHRNAALLAVLFLAIHIITTVLDGFAPISLIAAFIPFTSSYRPLWLGLGTVACDLLIALVASSLLRRQLGHRAWQAIHWCAYACWPFALIHGLGTGSDAKSGWLLALTVVCTAAILSAVAVRIWHAAPDRPVLRGAAALGALAFVIFILVWVPSGPLSAEWARRSGTPTYLLSHAERARAQALSGSVKAASR